MKKTTYRHRLDYYLNSVQIQHFCRVICWTSQESTSALAMHHVSTVEGEIDCAFEPSNCCLPCSDGLCGAAPSENDFDVFSVLIEIPPLSQRTIVEEWTARSAAWCSIALVPELPEVLTDVDNDEELLNDADDFEPDVTVIDLVSPPLPVHTLAKQEPLGPLLKQQPARILRVAAEDTSTHLAHS